jgi:truncated hemoglobin YjbI
VDPFAIIMFGGVGALIVVLLLIGKYYPGSGADVLDWHPTRSPEVEAQNEVDDLEQMLAATNAKRRRRGQPELTEQTINSRVLEDRALQKKWVDDLKAAKAHAAAEAGEPDEADQEILQVLNARNARRRRRGLPEQSEADFRAELGSGAADGAAERADRTG